MTNGRDGGGGTDEVTEAAVLKEVSVATVVVTLCPLPMLLSVVVAADRRRWLREVTEAAALTREQRRRF